MKNIALAAVCTVALSGCSLPIGVSVASWAADGISVLTTKKTILDHGLSYASGKDCALWRFFTDESICKIDDGTTAVADAGDPIAKGYSSHSSDPTLTDYRKITGGSGSLRSSGPVIVASLDNSETYSSSDETPWYRRNRNKEFLALMPKSFAAESGQAQVVKQTPSPAARTGATPMPIVAETRPAKPVREAVVASLDNTGADSTVASGETPAPAIDIEYTTLGSDHDTADVVAVAAVDASTSSSTTGGSYARPGSYFVIGSFAVWSNATRFAEAHNTLAARIHDATVNGKAVYRVVVGPYRADEKDSLKSAIQQAGIAKPWSMSVEQGTSVAAWGANGAQQVAELPTTPNS